MKTLIFLILTMFICASASAQPAHELTHVVQQNGFTVHVEETDTEQVTATAKSPKKFRCLRKKKTESATVVIPLSNRLNKKQQAKLKNLKRVKMKHGDKVITYKITRFESYKKRKKGAELRLRYSTCLLKK